MVRTRALVLVGLLGLVACQQRKVGAGGDTLTAMLVVDANRDGTVDVAGKSDDSGRNDFTTQSGAIVLANIDDDDGDGKLDSEDDVVNGPDDLSDLSIVALRPQPGLASSVSGSLRVDAASAPNVHVFRVNGAASDASSYTLEANPSDMALSNADLHAGVTFAVEATSVVTTDAAGAWDGNIHLTLETSRGNGDEVRLRVAPVLFQFNTAETRTVFYTDGGGADTTLLTTGLAPVCQSPVKTVGLRLNADFDQWTQDFFDVGLMSKPGPGGKPVSMLVAIRSPEPDRSAGAAVLKDLLGPDFGNLYVHGPQDASTDGYSMNSFGNWDVVPPYEKDGHSYPLGRSVWGMGTRVADQPNQAYQSFVRAQGVQPAFTVDSSWLAVGHIDEFFSWVKTNTPRGWGMLVGSPSMSRDMLQAMHDAGNGSVQMFVGKQEYDFNRTDPFGNNPLVDATRTVDDVLGDADLMAESQYAQTQIDKAVLVMQDEVGLADNEFTPLPFLYGRVYGKALGYQPGTVNLLYVNGGVAVPKPFGPSINGQDPFEQDLTSRLGALGLNVSFVDDWDLYHIEMGEVHCGTNVIRDMQLPWWESGR